MKALVTGAGGFLGRYLAEQLLARGDQVIAPCRRPAPFLESAGAKVVQADLRDAEAVDRICRDIDCVFHVAAVAGIGGMWRHYYENNTLATLHLLEASQRHGVGRFVFTSSPSVVFAGQDQCGIDESTPYPTRWLEHYPHTKALAEQAVLDAHQKQGLLTCSLRPHLIWGPRDQALIPRLLERAEKGRLVCVGDRKNLIDIIYVENAALAHLQAADALQPGSPVGGRAYFLSQGEPVNCWEWIDELLALKGLPPVKKSISLKTAWRIGACCEFFYKLFHLRREPPMTRFLAAQLACSHYYNINRAKEDFGYVPKISTAEGMRRLGESMK